jgi:uncharacterized protein
MYGCPNKLVRSLLEAARQNKNCVRSRYRVRPIFSYRRMNQSIIACISSASTALIDVPHDFAFLWVMSQWLLSRRLHHNNVSASTRTSTSAKTMIFDEVTNKAIKLVQGFYLANSQIKASHGWQHVHRVYQHAEQAIQCHTPAIPSTTATEIRLAALLHDVDDSKYFPQHANYENARSLLTDTRTEGVPNVDVNVDSILEMIGWVSCSKNGNRVPPKVLQNEAYHFLIPRWADRLEAVGTIGVVRCYQYNQEHGLAMSCATSPRASTVEEVWKLATPERFEEYLSSGGHSDDMISHYYDKLLHVACPSAEMVRNSYLEQMAQNSSEELMEVCLRYGTSGQVDEAYLQQVAKRMEDGGLKE